MKKIIIVNIIAILLTACVPEKYKNREVYVPEPKVYKIDSNVKSIDFLPSSYNLFFYLKDSKNAFNTFEKGELYNSIKDNYLFLDLKYNYLENIDLFFTKFNFDFNNIFNYINSDTLFGLTENSFFLVASMTFESKILVSILNIAPDNIIRETEYAGHKIYSVKKGNSSIYYTVINGYIVFTDSISGVKESISSVMDPKTDYNHYVNSVEDNEVVYVTKVNSSNNPFDIFPEVSEVEVNYNVINHNVSFKTTPNSSFKKYNDSQDKLYHETLKYLKPQTPLIFYNSSYNLGEILKSLVSSDNLLKYQLTIQRIEKILGGVYFLVDDIEPLLYSNDPGLGLILNLKPDGKDYKKIVELIGSLLGTKWIEVSNDNGCILYNSTNSFSLVVKPENIGIFTNNSLAENFKRRIIKPEYSLYDQYENLFGNNNEQLDSFMCYNPMGINKTSIQLLKKYLFSQIHMTEEEYNKSFGNIIEIVSNFNPGYIEYKFDKKSNKFYGSIKKDS